MTANDKNSSRIPFEQVYAQEEKAVYLFLVGQFGKGFSKNRLDRTTLKDIAQQTFINASRAYNRFEGRSKVKTWLCQIAYNVARSYLRTHKLSMRQTDSIDSMDGLIEKLPSTEQTGRESLEEREIYGKLRQAIRELQVTHRTVLNLYLRDNSYEEIARTLDIKVGTVKSRMSRAKQTLYEKVYGFDGRRHK